VKHSLYPLTPREIGGFLLVNHNLGCTQLVMSNTQTIEVVTYQDDAIKLRQAIGVMVPTLLRVLLQLLPADAKIDRESTHAVLDRVNKAMEETEHLAEYHTRECVMRRGIPS
jgi:hypothetical protein